MRKTTKSKEEFFDAKAKFLRNERVRYENGLPSSYNPERDLAPWERNPEDLAWFLSDSAGDLNTSALEWAEVLFDWMDSNGGKAPSKKAKDSVEKVLGTKLSNTRINKNNNKDGWPNYGAAILKLAAVRGYPDVFNTTNLAGENLEWAEELFDWMDSNGGSIPKRGANNQKEKNLGIKLSSMRHRNNYNSGGWTTYGSKLLKLAKKRGYLDVFNTTDLASKAIERAEKLFDWMDSNGGKAPSKKAKDSVEKVLGTKLCDMKQNKKNKRGWKIYGSKLLKLAKKRGYLDVFNTIDLTCEALAWAEDLFGWMDVHEGEAPSQKSKDPTEKALGSKLSNMRQNKKNNSQGWTTYGSELLKLAKRRGYPKVFNTRGSR